VYLQIAREMNTLCFVSALFKLGAMQAPAFMQHRYCALQAKSLTAAVTSLQIAGCQAGDTEAAGLRSKVAQMEGLLRTKEKDLEKARWVESMLLC